MITAREHTVSPALTKSVQLVCPLCSSHCEAVFPWDATVEEKTRIRHQVIEEHRRVCTAGPAEVGRVYEVRFPRA